MHLLWEADTQKPQLLYVFPVDSCLLLSLINCVPCESSLQWKLTFSSPNFSVPWGQRKGIQPALALCCHFKSVLHSLKYELFIYLSSPWVSTLLQDLLSQLVFPLPASIYATVSTPMVLRPLTQPQWLQTPVHLRHFPPWVISDLRFTVLSTSKTLDLIP